MQFANIFSEFMACHSLNGTFQESRVFNHKLIIFMSQTFFGVTCMKSLPNQCLSHIDFSPIVSSRSL